MYYMIGGSSKKNQHIGEEWFTKHPAAAVLLLQRLTPVVIEYLSAQVAAGAHMLQVFEAMGMFIARPFFDQFALSVSIVCTVHIHCLHSPYPLFAQSVSIVCTVRIRCLHSPYPLFAIQ